jgi:hypothetical protein
VRNGARSRRSLLLLVDQWIAEQFDFSRSREKLSWGHNAEVAALPRAEADELLDQAEAEKMSTRELLAAIWSENAPRRSASKGAKAMVAACMFPDPEKGGRGQKGSATEQFPGVSRKMLSEARSVLALAPDLVGERPAPVWFSGTRGTGVSGPRRAAISSDSRNADLSASVLLSTIVRSPLRPRRSNPPSSPGVLHDKPMMLRQLIALRSGGVPPRCGSIFGPVPK